MKSRSIAGLSMKGGRKDKFFFCLLEYYADSGRWFLRSFLQAKDEEGISGDEAIRSWIEKFDIEHLVLDFPLSSPPCHSCQLECPGSDSCPVESVTKVREIMNSLKEEDARLAKENPKKYEQERNHDDEFDFCKDILAKETHEHMLSRSFKRRLKKGILPYWNRPLDFFLWFNYYDQLLDLFNSSYDSFGNTSLMIQSRFSYLRRHLPSGLELFEGNSQLTLIELLRSKIIQSRDIQNINDIELGAEARLNIIKRIEKYLNIFIYDQDLEIICKHPRAFDSFLMTLSGQNIHLKQNRELPDWAEADQCRFIIPSFLG
jgi:hypothetical protein